MKNVSNQSHQHEQKRKERKNGICGNGKCEGVNFGPHHVARGGADEAFVRCRTKLGRTFLFSKFDGSDGRHWFPKYYQTLTALTSRHDGEVTVERSNEARSHITCCSYVLGVAAFRS